MQLENDNEFNTLYNVEFNRIPFIFRFGKKRAKAIIIALIVLFVALCVVATLMLDALSGTEVAPSAEGLETATVIIGICTAFTAAWICLSQFFERRAFRKASNLSAMVKASERHRTEIEFQNWKMQNRDY